jgi:hypothetical protein
VHRDQGKSGFENSFSGQKAANTAADAIVSLGDPENQPLTKKRNY